MMQDHRPVVGSHMPGCHQACDVKFKYISIHTTS